MTRTIIYHCDRCKAEMRGIYYGGVQYWIEDHRNSLEHMGVRKFELCIDCYNAVVYFMDNVKSK